MRSRGKRFALIAATNWPRNHNGSIGRPGKEHEHVCTLQIAAI